MRTKRRGMKLLGLAATLAVSACTAAPMEGLGGGAGATAGGAQDIALARQVIESGGIPTADQYTVEGLYAEHDMPLPAPACSRTLCINGRGGANTFVDDDATDAIVQIGFSSGINAATFQRKPLNLSLVVDISGSMAGDKIERTRDALHRIVDRMNEGDRLALTIFDDNSQVLRGPDPVTDHDSIHTLIDDHVHDRGSTNMAAGLSDGYAQAALHRGQPGILDRVILITDAVPNTGMMSDEEFINQATQNAEAGVGLTVFGVGTDFNNELVYKITHLRGGNYYFIADAPRLTQVVDEEFDFMVTPVAYDLRLEITPAEGLQMKRVYGLPEDAVTNGGMTLEVATVFLSKRKGGMALRLDVVGGLDDEAAMLVSSLAYTDAATGEAQESALQVMGDARRLGSNPEAAPEDPAGIERIASLTNMFLAMREASEFAATPTDENRQDASDAITKAISQLQRVSTSVNDPTLSTEAQLLEKLKQNVAAARGQ
ncbi:MAG: VWA domain-containing protein [Myxococcota bacterium]